MPADDNLLERAFMARIRADEHREALAALQQEFDERPDVIDLKRRIERCEEVRRQCIAQAQAEGVTKQGSFRLKVRTRKTRTVIPERFFARFGAETFVRCCDPPRYNHDFVDGARHRHPDPALSHLSLRPTRAGTDPDVRVRVGREPVTLETRQFIYPSKRRQETASLLPF